VLRLEDDCEVKCPRCRRWHRVIGPHSEGTPYTVAMRYVECARGERFYVGQLGYPSRHDVRRQSGAGAACQE
jgi:hypothetical protein